MYLNEDGERVKLDKRGKPYKVDEDGFRKFYNSLRPKSYTPEEWRKLPVKIRDEIKEAQVKEKEAEKAKKKSEKSAKEAKAKSKRREEIIWIKRTDC